ncbi:MAG: hypothetical protein KME22_10190 [Hassallia sp. WJT32-NPBG1]|jgi:S-adenosylmethionine/arginine decarboxylase-like enzyme|nr:hypothetical protein [Hassallia sp. WJT32-NPBG1]
MSHSDNFGNSIDSDELAKAKTAKKPIKTKIDIISHNFKPSGKSVVVAILLSTSLIFAWFDPACRQIYIETAGAAITALLSKR